MPLFAPPAAADVGDVALGSTPTTSAVGDVAAGGSAATASKNDHTHGREAFATNTIALGTAAAPGVATTPMRSDDTILAFDATAPVTQAIGDAAAVGAATTTARRDHKHGMPAFAAPALTLGTANAAGAAATLIRTDATILAFDATAPTTSAVGDAAVVGAATTAARRDHTHGREAFATNAILLGTAAAAGAATTHLRSNDTIAAFDTTAPTISFPNDTATTGAAAFAPRRDHTHGRDQYLPTISNGWMAWSFDPAWSNGTTGTIAAAIIYAVKVPFPQGGTVGHVDLYGIAKATGTLTDSFVTIWGMTGTMLGQSADQSSAWNNATGFSSNTWLSPAVSATCPAGVGNFVWVSVYGGTVGTAGPNFRSGNVSVGIVNGPTAAQALTSGRAVQFGVADTSTMPSITTTNWVASTVKPILCGLRA